MKLNKTQKVKRSLLKKLKIPIEPVKEEEAAQSGSSDDETDLDSDEEVT